MGVISHDSGTAQKEESRIGGREKRSANVQTRTAERRAIASHRTPASRRCRPRPNRGRHSPLTRYPTTTPPENPRTSSGHSDWGARPGSRASRLGDVFFRRERRPRQGPAGRGRARAAHALDGRRGRKGDGAQHRSQVVPLTRMRSTARLRRAAAAGALGAGPPHGARRLSAQSARGARAASGDGGARGARGARAAAAVKRIRAAVRRAGARGRLSVWHVPLSMLVVLSLSLGLGVDPDACGGLAASAAACADSHERSQRGAEARVPARVDGRSALERLARLEKAAVRHEPVR